MTSTATTAPAGIEERARADQPAPNVFRLSGVIAQGDRPWEGEVAIADPALYAARVVRRGAGGEGHPRSRATVRDLVDPLPEGMRVLAFRDSPPLAELLRS